VPRDAADAGASGAEPAADVGSRAGAGDVDAWPGAWPGARLGAWPAARRLAAWAWTLAICVFLWMPPPPPPEIVWPWWDSLVHTGLFAGFGALWTWRGLGSARVLVLGACMGAVTELGQALVPWERHASWDDLAFDVLGATIGWLAAGGAWRKRS
jgi:VanZ family protein